MINNKIKHLPLWIPAERFCQVIKLVWTSEHQLWSNKKEIENLQPRAAHTSLGSSHAGRPSGSRRAQPHVPAGKGLREGEIKAPFTVEVHWWHFYERQPRGWAALATLQAAGAAPAGQGAWALPPPSFFLRALPWFFSSLVFLFLKEWV